MRAVQLRDLKARVEGTSADVRQPPEFARYRLRSARSGTDRAGLAAIALAPIGRHAGSPRTRSAAASGPWPSQGRCVPALRPACAS